MLDNVDYAGLLQSYKTTLSWLVSPLALLCIQIKADSVLFVALLCLALTFFFKLF